MSDANSSGNPPALVLNADVASSIPSSTGVPRSNTLAPPGILEATGTAGSGEEQTISYSAERIIGNGSFGVVFQATVVETGDVVAIKKVRLGG